MFAGIIQAQSRIHSSQDRDGTRLVRIRTPRGWRLTEGQSVAVDGICSTVVRAPRGYFDVEYMPETLAKTTAANFAKDRPVNLERSLKLSSVVDGHLVQGHVDAKAPVARVEAGDGVFMLTVALPEGLLHYVAPRGSVALNGVSLTVAHVGKNSCSVALVPYTLAHTNLGALREGDSLNIETDLIARYLGAIHTV